MGRIVVEDLVPALLESRKDVYVGKRCFVPNGKCGQKKKSKKELFRKLYNFMWPATIGTGFALQLDLHLND